MISARIFPQTFLTKCSKNVNDVWDYCKMCLKINIRLKSRYKVTFKFKDSFFKSGNFIADIIYCEL